MDLQTVLCVGQVFIFQTQYKHSQFLCVGRVFTNPVQKLTIPVRLVEFLEILFKNSQFLCVWSSFSKPYTKIHYFCTSVEFYTKIHNSCALFEIIQTLHKNSHVLIALSNFKTHNLFLNY